MAEFAKDKPAGFKNAIERVAIAGAGGTVGSQITSCLLNTGKHTVTALTRKGSNSKDKLPQGIHIATVDYDDEASVVSALQGQQFLIITLSPTAPRDSHSKLVRAAAKAGVAYIMPNEYGLDPTRDKLGQETMLGPPAQANRDEIERLGMKWITVCCGFWYDYSLAGGESRFGFDFDKRSVTMYDDGRTRISVSTLALVGRAVAKLLSLKEVAEEANEEEVTVSGWANKPLYVASFVINQQEMFDSVKRVTGTSDSDWTVTYQSSKERYEQGLALVRTGNMAGFPKLLYARGLYPADPSDFSAKTQNTLLGLSPPPEESLDEATRAAIAMDRAYGVLT